jgi:hypothetical protein
MKKSGFNKKQPPLHITGLYMQNACGILGYEKPQSGYALYGVFLRHI